MATVVLTASPGLVAAQEPGDVDQTDPSVTGIATPPPPGELIEAGSPEDPSATSPDGNVASRADVAKYRFSAEGYAAVQAAANAAAIPAGCPIDRRGIAFMVLAPTFRETGAGSPFGPHPSATPSPMTLSRWDNQTNLHSLSNPGAFTRVFWHPGIGAWQFDSAGGWGKTAYERIDMTKIAATAVQVMLSGFCQGHAIAYQRFLRGEIEREQIFPDARNRAWDPWVACWRSKGDYCEPIYTSMYNDGIIADATVSAAGGATASTCTIPGSPTPRTCYRIDPGSAQGYRSSWVGQPDGNASLAPLSYPFYSLSDGAREWRIWQAADTGLGVTFWASKPLGVNARNAGAITWYHEISIDSLATSGAAGSRTVLASMGGGIGAHALVGNFKVDPRAHPDDRSARDDVFFYAPGGIDDYLVNFDNQDQPTKVKRSIYGTYQPLVGDFDGNGFDDIFWYAPGPAEDSIWWSDGSSPDPFHTTTHQQVRGDYRPLVGDFTGDDVDDIFWYAPGTASDSVWRGQRGQDRFIGTTTNINGYYSPLVADLFADRGGDEIIWWTNSGSDSVWDFTPTGGVHGTPLEAPSANQGVVGDYDGDGADDVFWLGNGARPDGFWFGTASRSVDVQAQALNGTYIGLAADLDGSGHDDLILFGPGGAYDSRWVLPNRTVQSRAIDLPSPNVPQRFIIRSSRYDDLLFFDG